jgi:hypothetical protein
MHLSYASALKRIKSKMNGNIMHTTYLEQQVHELQVWMRNILPSALLMNFHTHLHFPLLVAAEAYIYDIAHEPSAEEGQTDPAPQEPEHAALALFSDHIYLDLPVLIKPEAQILGSSVPYSTT